MRASVLAACLLLLAACAGLPEHVERAPSHALARPQATALGKAFSPPPGTAAESGFAPVVAGANAFLLRAAMAGVAEQTLDLQYYIWEDDLTGRMMLRDVMRAADRGVRVRLLLDDVHTDGDAVIFTLVDAHPLIEVRLFNPFVQRDLRVADWLLRSARLNHRMHNKVFVADNALALTGGRNIGDHYFAVDEASNFRDLDLLAAGPAVRELSSMFDAYWNSEWSYPVAAIEPNDYTGDDARALAQRLERSAGLAQAPFPLDADRAAMRARLRDWRDDLVWAPAVTVYDSPGKLNGEHGGRRVMEALLDTVTGVREELLIEMAYVVPTAGGVELLGSLVERGVDVAILTNSLATNDVIAAHAGYMDYRRPLLEAGVRLHELRPDALSSRRHRTLLASGSEAALHTKALVYDRRVVFIGSFNLDPRSLGINTEMGLLIRSPRLAGQLATLIEDGLRPANSFRLALRDGELRWRAVDGGEVRWLTHDPQTSWWQRFVAGFLSFLPIDEQL